MDKGHVTTSPLEAERARSLAEARGAKPESEQLSALGKDAWWVDMALIHCHGETEPVEPNSE